MRGERDLEIATTRPELLPACVALYRHPDDPRYAGLERAVVPPFGYEVPVLADRDVDPEYGTGLMMVCTFGDNEDVLRWRRDQLELRQPRRLTRRDNDLRHVDVVKNLRWLAYLRHNGVVKNVRPLEGPTRGQVARLILELGPSTAATLGGRLGLTPAAIRRHLDNLLAEGLIETRTARTYGNRGRGRPAKVFVITDAGRSAFEHAYDGLATGALRFLAERAGPDAIAEFARTQVADLERRYAPVVGTGVQGELAARVQALAEALSADGYAASAGPAPAVGAASPSGEQLCQHHCPVAHVAAEFPQLCEAETEAFGRLLGAPVQRLATIAHGDGICTTHVTSVASFTGAGKAGPARDVVKQVPRENHPESGGLLT